MLVNVLCIYPVQCLKIMAEMFEEIAITKCLIPVGIFPGGFNLWQIEYDISCVAVYLETSSSLHDSTGTDLQIKNNITMTISCSKNQVFCTMIYLLSNVVLYNQFFKIKFS